MEIRTVTLDAIDRASRLTQVADCARRSFALRVLGNAGESLRVESFHSDEKKFSQSILALRVATNTER